MDEQTRDDAQESLVRVGADALAAQITRPWSRHKSSEFTHGQGALLHAQRFRAAATHRRDQLARRQQGYDRADRERLRHGPELELLHAHMRSSASENYRLPMPPGGGGVKAVFCSDKDRTVLRRAHRPAPHCGSASRYPRQRPPRSQHACASSQLRAHSCFLSARAAAIFASALACACWPVSRRWSSAHPGQAAGSARARRQPPPARGTCGERGDRREDGERRVVRGC